MAGMMGLEGATVAAIAAMAVATYACRAGGYWLLRRLHPSRFIRAMLAALPGALFIAFVVPALAAGGAMQWAGAAATLAMVAATGNVALGIIAGTGTAWVVWALR